MMPRVFTNTRLTAGESLPLSGEDGHHFVRVLRVKKGEEVAVATPAGTYLATVEQVRTAEATVVLSVLSRLPSHESAQQIFLIQGIPKGDKVDTILQKCTEVGVAGVLLMQAKRSVVQLEAKKLSGRLSRWEKIAQEAASQSQRDVVPVVRYASTRQEVKEFLHRLGTSRVLLLDEEEQTTGIRTLLQRTKTFTPANAIVIAVGPEGGWDDSERDWWHNEVGAEAVSIGPRILRTETAGVVAVSAVLYEYGQLGG